MSALGRFNGNTACKTFLETSRFQLALQTAQIELPLLERSTKDSFSLYVSIPFCPSRCTYCSFVSHSVEQAAKLIPAYIDKLIEELAEIGQLAQQLKLKLRTIYFGGGTPTVLSADQLGRLMEAITKYFDLSDLWEYTIEAGRPDTITKEKLETIRKMGAGRILKHFLTAYYRQWAVNIRHSNVWSVTGWQRN